MSSTNVRGVSRVLDKLENSVKNGEYYEAHQMYKTLYFRYLAQQKYTELLDMLHEGSVLFLDHDQQNSGADLGILLVDVLVKSENKNFVEWTPKLCKIFGKIHGNIPERETFLVNSIQWSSKDRVCSLPVFHQSVAQVYWNEKNYIQARHHYLHSKDGHSCAKLLIEFQITKGFTTEVDLFIAQAVLQFLCLRNKSTATSAFANYTQQHPSIKRSGPPYLLPLLNFIWFLLQAIDSQKLATFTVLCQQYEASLKRDPTYAQYLDKIGQIFFNVKPQEVMKPGGASGRMFGNFFQTFLDGLDDDDSSDDDDRASTHFDNKSRASSSKKPIETTDLD